MTKPPASWQLPSPVVFTASDPHAADGKAGVGTILTIHENAIGLGQPYWVAPNSAGYVLQAEGQPQADAAAAWLKANPLDGRLAYAIVTNLGIDPQPFLALGVTSVMVECYAQDDVIHTSIPRMRYQALVEGWPHVIPVLGVYDAINLEHYLHFAGGGPNIPGNGGPVGFKHGHWRGGPLGIYLAEGMGDTLSWPALAAL